MIINADRETVSIIDLDNKHTRVEEVVSRELFTVATGIVIPAGVTGWVYEPDRDMYVVLHGKKDILALAEPTDSLFMTQIHTKADEIVHLAVGRALVHHVYDELEDLWYIPEATQAQLDKLGRQSMRIATLQNATRHMFKMLLALFQTGRDKGLWSATDFDAELRSKVAEWQQLLNDYDSEDAS